MAPAPPSLHAELLTVLGHHFRLLSEVVEASAMNEATQVRILADGLSLFAAEVQAARPASTSGGGSALCSWQPRGSSRQLALLPEDGVVVPTSHEMPNAPSMASSSNNETPYILEGHEGSQQSGKRSPTDTALCTVANAARASNTPDARLKTSVEYSPFFDNLDKSAVPKKSFGDMDDAARSGEFFSLHFEDVDAIAVSAKLSSREADIVQSINSLIRSSSHLKSTVVEIMSYFSRVWTVAFFLGGLAAFEDWRIQMCYDLVFIGSYLMCFGSCLTNLFLQTPPYYNVGMDLVTLFFHIIGGHTWFFWRRFVHDPELVSFVRKFFMSKDRSRSISSFRREVKAVGWLIAGYQITLIGLSYVVFPQMAWEHWDQRHAPQRSSVDGQASDTRFALVHAVLMWVSLPSVVPTFIVGHGLFFFVNRLHCLDAHRALELMRSAVSVVKDAEGSTPTSMPGGAVARRLMTDCCELADASQRRLDFSCGKWSNWWIHMLAFTFAQVVAVASQVGLNISRGFPVDTRRAAFQIAYDGWHGIIGAVGLVALLITPAHATYLYMLLPRKFLVGLRATGHTFLEANGPGLYLTLRIRGFTVLDLPITKAWVAKFMSFVMLGIPLYIRVTVQYEVEE